jgi:hypothetical protein
VALLVIADRICYQAAFMAGRACYIPAIWDVTCLYLSNMFLVLVAYRRIVWRRRQRIQRMAYGKRTAYELCW